MTDKKAEVPTKPKNDTDNTPTNKQRYTWDEPVLPDLASASPVFINIPDVGEDYKPVLVRSHDVEKYRHRGYSVIRDLTSESPDGLLREGGDIWMVVPSEYHNKIQQRRRSAQERLRDIVEKRGEAPIQTPEENPIKMRPVKQE